MGRAEPRGLRPVTRQDQRRQARQETHAAEVLMKQPGDFYAIESLLDEPDRCLLQRVRAFMEEEVAPIISTYWQRAEFPFHILPKMRELCVAGLPYNGGTAVLDGLVSMELARVDCSIATFLGVHSGLAMGSIYLCGSEEQRQHWLPPMQRMELI